MNGTDSDSCSIITNPPCLVNADIQLYYVPNLQSSLTTNAVNNLLVYRNTTLPWKTTVPEKRTFAVFIGHKVSRRIIEFLG
jgi:hypothetical protein